MNIENLIHNIFHTNQYTLTDMKKGLTNKNYKLFVNGRYYVMRIPYDDSDQIVQRDHEIQAMMAVSDFDIDVKSIYFNQKSGTKITEYIEHATEFKDCTLPDKIERTAYLMKKFHSLKLKIDADFQPLKRLYQYQKHVKHPLYDLREYKWIEDTLLVNQQDHILCHNDWVSGNILFTKSKEYLIDYEYAANNDPLFDVMSFLSENEITDEKERQRFYEIYFDYFDTSIQKQLDKWENFHNLLWCNWAMMMYESRQEEIYKSIAEAKYRALHKCM